MESFDGLEACPQCGSDGIPSSYENQVTVSVNVQELRVLCHWAENYAIKIGAADVIYSIALRLRKQLPKDTPLTMADEFQELKECGYKFQTNHPAADTPETGDSFVSE